MSNVDINTIAEFYDEGAETLKEVVCYSLAYHKGRKEELEKMNWDTAEYVLSKVSKGDELDEFKGKLKNLYLNKQAVSELDEYVYLDETHEAVINTLWYLLNELEMVDAENQFIE